MTTDQDRQVLGRISASTLNAIREHIKMLNGRQTRAAAKALSNYVMTETL
ncbi:MAG TPA: hypothetical protein VEH06_06020 [Candidatus Bathyarchaeia archaeon]|nr:hypothetical protein [Candidatus Bathyarchaeia archaeon]